MGYEMDAIAAAVVGGASLDGGEGTVIGTVFGTMIMATIRQGGTLLGVNPFVLEIIVGLLIVIAVLVDKQRKKV
jgi:ribose transport system permease protein